MGVFSLRDTVVGEYRKFATSFTTIHAEDIWKQVEATYAKDRYWPEPLIQINPSYERTTSVQQLVAAQVLEPKAAEIFRTAPATDAPRGVPLSLYKHQEQAIAFASQDESYVVTTGTGSGKSLCWRTASSKSSTSSSRTCRGRDRSPSPATRGKRTRKCDGTSPTMRPTSC